MSERPEESTVVVSVERTGDWPLAQLALLGFTGLSSSLDPISGKQVVGSHVRYDLCP